MSIGYVKPLRTAKKPSVYSPIVRIHKSVEFPPLTFPGATLDDPPKLYKYLKEFRSHHPDPYKTAFIMMRFGASLRHDRILEAIRTSLAKWKIEALRADDKAYVDYLMPNLRTYMHGCGFGVAVFERIESDWHNPNVALEVGYMLALGKRVCLLKEKSISSLPTDIIGSLYTDFDMDDIENSIHKAIQRWLKQRGLISG